jgi:hypothetical protein
MLAFSMELRRRDDGFMQVVVVGDGSGTYEARSDGKTVTRRFTFDSNGAILTPAFAPAVDAVTVASAFDVKKLRAAALVAPASDAYTRRRLDAMHATRAALDAEEPPRLTTAAELEPYAAPSPYAAGLAALKKETR